MSNRLGAGVVLMLGMLILSGCGNSARQKLGTPSKAANWPAQKALTDPSLSLGIAMNLQRGDVAGARKAAADAKFEEAVTTFEKEPIPKEFASPAREDAKKEVVEAYRKLIEKGKGNASAKDMKEAFDATTKAMSKMVDYNLK